MAHESDAARIARLEERSESILRELQRIGGEMERVVGPQAGELIRLVSDIGALTEDFEQFRRELRERAGMSASLKIALISAGGAIVVAIIVAVSGGHP